MTKSGYWKTNLSRSLSMFQMFRAQVGRSAEKDRLFAMLLNVDDLGGSGWTVSSEVAYFTGAGRKGTPEISRARESGSITTVRRLKSELRTRLVSLAVFPLADAADANSYLPNSIVRSARKPFSKVAETEENDVSDHELPGLPDAVLYEVKYVDPPTSGGERVVAKAIDNLVMIANFRDTQELWPWQELAEIASQQVAKIRGSLSEP